MSTKSIQTDDPRSLRSKTLLREAFMDLLEERGFSDVSVTDICRRAGLNRVTFYLHYSDKYALLEECLLELLSIPQDIIDTYKGIKQADSTPFFMKYVAEKCTRRKKFFLSILEAGQYPAYYELFSGQLESGIHSLVTALIREQNIPEPDESRVVFLTSALLGSLLYWVKNEDARKIDKFCNSMMQYIMAVLTA